MDPDRGSFLIGRVLGIPVRLHFLFLVLLGAQSLGALVYGKWYVLYWFVLLGPVLLLTVLVHELGHCLAARQVGGSATGILLWPLGGLAYIGHAAGPKADMWVAVAGPLTHAPMIAIWLAVLFPATHAATGSWAITLALPPVNAQTFGMALCSGALVMNLSLLLFNLLVPAYPMDGGRLLVDALLWRGVSAGTTAKVAICLSAPIGVGLIVWGAVQFQLVTILVGAWLLHSVYQLFSCLRANQLHLHPLFAHSAAADTAPSAAEAGAYQKPPPNAAAAAGATSTFDPNRI